LTITRQNLEGKFRLFNDEELRRLVAEGRASGEPVDGEAVLRRLRAKYTAMSTPAAR